MSGEDISMHVSKQKRHAIHPFHEETIVRHAVRNIKGGKLLCDKASNKPRQFTQRLPEYHDLNNDNMKVFWS